jgi:hypothetical protein
LCQPAVLQYAVALTYGARMIPLVTRQCAVMQFASGVGQRVSLTLPVTMPPGVGDQAAGSRMEKYLEKVIIIIYTMLVIALISV